MARPRRPHEHENYSPSAVHHGLPGAAEVSRLRQLHPGHLLLLRAPRQYHLVGADAHEARRLGVPDVFPLGSLDLHLPRLLAAGHRVALVEPGLAEPRTF